VAGRFFLRLGLLGRKLKLEMVAIVGQRGVLLVGRIDEGAADGFVRNAIRTLP